MGTRLAKIGKLNRATPTTIFRGLMSAAFLAGYVSPAGSDGRMVPAVRQLLPGATEQEGVRKESGRRGQGFPAANTGSVDQWSAQPRKNGTRSKSSTTPGEAVHLCSSVLSASIAASETSSVSRRHARSQPRLSFGFIHGRHRLHSSVDPLERPSALLLHRVALIPAEPTITRPRMYTQSKTANAIPTAPYVSDFLDTNGPNQKLVKASSTSTPIAMKMAPGTRAFNDVGP